MEWELDLEFESKRLARLVHGVCFADLGECVNCCEMIEMGRESLTTLSGTDRWIVVFITAVHRYLRFLCLDLSTCFLVPSNSFEGPPLCI